MNPSLLRFAVALACLVLGCGTTDPSLNGATGDGGDAGAGRVCTKSTDCTGNTQCAFKISEGCNAVGLCVPHTGAGACDAATRPICACDGTTQAISGGCDLPQGYEEQPITHAGACAGDAGHD